MTRKGQGHDPKTFLRLKLNISKTWRDCEIECWFGQTLQVQWLHKGRRHLTPNVKVATSKSLRLNHLIPRQACEIESLSKLITYTIELLYLTVVCIFHACVCTYNAALGGINDDYDDDNKNHILRLEWLRDSDVAQEGASVNVTK